MDANLWILAALVVILGALAFARDPRLPVAGVRAATRLLGSVWIEIGLGFLVAGLIDVWVSKVTLVGWLGDERGARGIVVGWLVGLAVPGGPYLLFPMVASLQSKGAAPGPLIALIAAKTLLSPVRMLTYEAPLLGWRMTLARLVPGLIVPPLLGLVGQALFRLLSPGSSATPP